MKKTCGSCKHCHIGSKLCGLCIDKDLWELEEIPEIKLDQTTLEKQMAAYISNDVRVTEFLYKELHMNKKPKIKNVIFNDPATIVFWTDNTKTVVKAQEGDVFDPEKGLAMAMVKKLYSNNKGNYCNEIKKWTKDYYQDRITFDDPNIMTPIDAINNAFEDFKSRLTGNKKED